MKRSPMRRVTPLVSRTPIVARRRPARSLEERDASTAWKTAVGPCQVCPAEGGVCEGDVQGHHAITQQALKNRGLHASLWDTRNKVDVCTHRHEQITTSSKPLPRRLLPAAVFEFADELGLGWYLDRFYPFAVVEAAA